MNRRTLFRSLLFLPAAVVAKPVAPKPVVVDPLDIDSLIAASRELAKPRVCTIRLTLDGYDLGQEVSRIQFEQLKAQRRSQA